MRQEWDGNDDPQLGCGGFRCAYGDPPNAGPKREWRRFGLKPSRPATDFRFKSKTIEANESGSNTRRFIADTIARALKNCSMVYNKRRCEATVRPLF